MVTSGGYTIYLTRHVWQTLRGSKRSSKKGWDGRESANDLLGRIINPYLTPDRRTKISES